MKKLILASVSAIFALCPARAEGDYDIYILLGQSNAVGFAPLEKGDENPVEGVFLLDSLGKVVPCSGVVNRFSSLPKLGNRMGYSLGVSFGKMMHAVTGRKILLVSNCKGATAISSWLPDAKDPLYYNEAVRRSLQAREYGTIKGILWHQGEGDSRWTGQYAKKAKLLFGSLRKDLGDMEIPVVVGEIGHWFTSRDGTVTADDINGVLRGLPLSIENTLCVTSEGCEPISDGIHFNHEALEILGRRYAAKMLSFGQGLLIDTKAMQGNGKEVMIAAKGWYHIYARGCSCAGGRMRIKFNQQLLSNDLGTSGNSWEYAGRVYLNSGLQEMFLSAKGGKEPHCDAVWITSHQGSIPPEDVKTIEDFK